jgi:hypothetical protein
MATINYDKSKAKGLDSYYESKSNVSHMINFSTSIKGSKLGKLALIVAYIGEGESHSKYEINREALGTLNDASYVAYYSFLSANDIIKYSAKTREWTRSGRYNQFIRDLESCISKKSKIELIKEA